MKIPSTRLTSGFARRAFLVAISLGLSAIAASAGQLNVTVPLATEAFGPGTDLHAQSTALVNPAADYYYRISGTCHGTGDFSNFVQPGTKISKLLNDVQAGAASSLIGVRHNQGGALPFQVLNKTYMGTYQGAVQFSATFDIQIDGTGLVKFDVTNVTASSPFGPVNGTIVFETGAKVLVGVAPVISLASATQTVNETAGTLSVVVNRTVNLGSTAMVNIATVKGTADNTDYAPISHTVLFDPGMSTKTIKITIKDSTATEDTGGQFHVVLSHPIAALLGEIKSETVTITE